MLVHLFVHLHDYFLADENPDSVRAMHRATLEAFARRDAGAISHAMDNHLRDLEQALLT